MVENKRLKERVLEELNLKSNMCFNDVEEIENKIRINKTKNQVSTTTEVREICNISEVLQKYQDDIKIKISLEEIIIEF